MTIVLLLLAIGQQFLLMQPIQDSIRSGDFRGIKPICQIRLSVNLEEPLAIKGYFYRDQLAEELDSGFSRVTADSIEWSSIQVEADIAVQSMNLVLKDRFSGRKFYYKLIFFMSKEKEWKLYYLRGLRI
jgi:hypothetical protein